MHSKSMFICLEHSIIREKAEEISKKLSFAQSPSSSVKQQVYASELKEKLLKQKRRANCYKITSA